MQVNEMSSKTVKDWNVLIHQRVKLLGSRINVIIKEQDGLRAADRMEMCRLIHL